MAEETVLYPFSGFLVERRPDPEPQPSSPVCGGASERRLRANCHLTSHVRPLPAPPPSFWWWCDSVLCRVFTSNLRLTTLTFT
jgi:hypothetical protein